jgi:glycosyltransferase involved in cell wall biosynthesis
MNQTFEENTRPKVSICMITYNHGQFIRQSINSILQQVTDFEYRIIIGEDSSTDDTRKICEEYAAIHPEKIQLITSENNVGMMANFTRTLKACKGRYIAFLEGDDYWTDSHKLQIQTDFLDANAEYSLCFHNATVKMDRSDGKREWVMPKNLEKESFDTRDLLSPWFIPSASCVFVNYTDLDLPEWYYHCEYGDLPLMLLLTLKGKFRYIDRNMAVYRLHDAGVSNLHKGLDKVLIMIFIYEHFNTHTKYRFQDKINECIKYEINKHALSAPVIIRPSFAISKPLILVNMLNSLKKALSLYK